MQTLETIWNKRINWLKDKTWRGGDPKCGFDFSEGINPHDRYKSNNWNDLTIQDFRELLYGINDGVTPKGFKSSYSTDGMEINTLQSINDPHVRIDVTQINEQTFCVLYLSETGVFSVSWYKNRGRIDSILNLEYGSAVTLIELTDILTALGLEQEWNGAY